MSRTLSSLWGVIKMLSVLKSDFYKLFLRRSFYVCGLISGALGVLLVVLINNQFPFAKEFGYNGINSITIGLGQVTLLTTVFVSMFIPSEFAYGTIKNICSKGINRGVIYSSKLLVGVFTSVIYTLFTAVCGFVAGSLMWGVGDFKQDEFLDIIKMVALFILAEICLQSVFIMIGFLIRHTGGTVAANLGIYIATDIIIIPIIDFMIKISNWVKLENSVSDYWVGSYAQNFLSNVNLQQDVITRGVIVCLAYLIVSTIIGMFVFYKRDIK